MQALRARQVKKGLVDGQGLYRRCDVLHHCPDASAFGGIYSHAWADHDGIRAGLECLEHGHGRAHAR